jgi:hypothetical protein
MDQGATGRSWCRALRRRAVVAAPVENFPLDFLSAIGNAPISDRAKEDVVNPESAFALMRERPPEIRRIADRRWQRLAVPATPRLLQRMALKGAGRGRRPAIISGRLVVPAGLTPAMP